MALPWKPLRCHSGYFMMVDVQACRSLVPADYFTNPETRREVELAALVERGSSRMLDKLEEKLERSKEQGNRLLVALGAL